MKHLSRVLFVAVSMVLLGICVQAQVDPKLYSDMKWREIGPMRAGRTRALAGVPSEPATFYLGAVNGGVWKTTDAGATWHSVWNKEGSGSIGSIAVSLSDPNTIYAGSGEGLQRPDLSTGDGVYKSTDAGKTWTHLEGLRNGQQIGQVAIDPRDANRVFVAVEGHPFGPNEERGLYRTDDGGKTFKRVLFVSNKTGASEVQIDPTNPQVVFAGMWQRQEAPWENGSFGGGEGGLYRSTDGGDTWKKLTGNGLPDEILQLQMTISPSNPKRIYAEIAPVKGAVWLYRSDDGGDHWVHAPEDDTRPEERIGGGDCPVPLVDPKDPDTVYVASIVSWKSTDAGKTWKAFRGSPGGDDYQNVWVNPNNTKIVALASDQGVVISQNGGESWAEWYNQATAQMYHATTDNAFPYRVCGGQQDSGSACVPSRSDDGRITFHDWHPVGIEEYGYAAPDPLDPDVVYGGKVTRYDRRTGQIQDVEPKPLRSYRALKDGAADVFTGRSAQAVLCDQHAVVDGGRREELERSQSGFVARDVGIAGGVRQLQGCAGGEGDAAGRDLCAGVVAGGWQSTVGGHGRRTDLDDGRCGRALDECDAACDEAVLEGVQHGCGTVRRADGICSREYDAAGRHAAAPLPHARWRQEAGRRS